MKKAIAVALFVGLIVGSLPAMAVSAGRTAVTHNCYEARTRPHGILFACGDGGYYATRLHWHHDPAQME